MAQKIIVQPNEWSAPQQRFKYATELEAGNILFFPTTPFQFPKAEIDFLLHQRQSASSMRKNIAYKPDMDRISNHDASDPVAAERMREILRNYSARVTAFLSTLLVPYANAWKHDYASFRPFQEKGRPLRVRARNDLLHVDSFPTRPMHGARILRFFTNINPTESRRWMTTLPFGELAQKFGGPQGVPFPRSTELGFRAGLYRMFKKLTKQPIRSPYDVFMLNLHNFLKENGQFQEQCPKDHWEFPPGSCWAVFTDMVSHAALSGQYALEQTFIIPKRALLRPELAPVSILERLAQRNMVDPMEAQV